jgi:ribosome maturation factor RimP
MIETELIRKLAEEKLSGTDLFLVDAEVKSGNNIQVLIDGRHDVTIDDCIAVSRHIESALDREQEDFNLQVSSAGIDKPLMYASQYIKNIGRRLSIDLKEGGNISGKLLNADENEIEIQTEKKTGRKTVAGKNMQVKYNDIEKAMCLVTFK